VPRGALVVDVKAGSPAAHAGLRGGNGDQNVLGQSIVTGGDVITAINGIAVDGADDVVRIVSSLEPTDVAVFSIARGGEHRKVAVTLGERQLPAG
jgi:S1-C subfamily serine protease